jgi:two-component system, response regulator RegA
MANILVLDDEPDAALLIKRVLQRKGYEVSTFTEEEEAIAFALSIAVDLAILDIRLKKMSGIEVLGRLKRINPTMHAIMLTGFPTIETAKRAEELGADQYCVKPIEIDELRQRVASILGPSLNQEEYKESLGWH